MKRRLLTFPALVLAFELVALLPASAGGPTFQKKWVTFGSAIVDTFDLRITPNTTNQTGAAWETKPRKVLTSFHASFVFDLDGPGADGFAFVVRGGSETLGSGADGLGYGGITKSLAVEFDTHLNTTRDDPNNNHVSAHTNCVSPNDSHESDSIGLGTPIADLNDGHDHDGVVSFAGGNLTVSVDDELLIDVVFDPTCLSLDKGKAFFGFTGATGGLAQIHTIESYEFRKKAP